MTEISTSRPAPVAQAFAWRLLWPQAALVLMVAALVAAGATGSLRVLYPVAALAVGWRLQRNSPARFIAFVIWLWLLSPLVRRMVDFSAGWQDPSIILLTPYLVTASAAIAHAAGAVAHPRHEMPPRVGRAMFVLVALGMASGIPLGFASGAAHAATEALNWVVPVAFGWYVTVCADPPDRIERTVATTLTSAMFVLGVYGTYQFFALPAWDAEWMQNSGMTSIGRPEALAVRVFSTAQSPGVLAFILLVSLALWLSRPRTITVPAACLGGVALVLTQVRTAWMALAIAALCVVPRLRSFERARVLLLIGLAVLGTLPFLHDPDVADLTSARVETLSVSPSEDESALSRWHGHMLTLQFVAEHPFGGGLGFSDDEIQESIGMNDSVAIATLVQFGIVGAAFYAAGIVGLWLVVWRYYRHASSAEALGLASAGLGLLATAGFSTVTAGPSGVLLWLIGGVAAKRCCSQPSHAHRETVSSLAAPVTA